jgi:hypothetical protein
MRWNQRMGSEAGGMSTQSAEWNRFQARVSETTFFRLVAVGVCSARQGDVQSGTSGRVALVRDGDGVLRMTVSERVERNGPSPKKGEASGAKKIRIPR